MKKKYDMERIDEGRGADDAELTRSVQIGG